MSNKCAILGDSSTCDCIARADLYEIALGFASCNLNAMRSLARGIHDHAPILHTYSHTVVIPTSME